MIYEKNGIVPASMCDATTKLSVISVFQLVEDAVTDLMADLHIDGITAMREYGAMWVFVKNAIRIFRRPEWREQYVIRSYISSFSAVKLMIDTEILSQKDQSPLAQSRLELCALDLQTGKIRKASSVGISSETQCFHSVEGLDFSRFPKKESEIVDKVRVLSTNIDYCSHTNNIEYVRFMLNTYSVKELAVNEIEKIEIHYGMQTFENDILSICKSGEDNHDFFAVCSEKGNAVECKIDFKR